MTGMLDVVVFIPVVVVVVVYCRDFYGFHRICDFMFVKNIMIFMNALIVRNATITMSV